MHWLIVLVQPDLMYLGGGGVLVVQLKLHAALLLLIMLSFFSFCFMKLLVDPDSFLTLYRSVWRQL
jgi:hypothetical protein